MENLEDDVPFTAETRQSTLPGTMAETEHGMIGPLAEVYAAGRIASAFRSPSPRARRSARLLFAVMVFPFAIAIGFAIVDFVKSLF